jgi:hypothetical protein
MENENTLKLLPLAAMARKLHVPVKWLKAEAEAGRIPHLQADRVLLFNAEIVQSLITERASKGIPNV